MLEVAYMLRFLEKHAAQAKDSGYSWIICLVCVMINFFVTGFTHTIGLLFSYLLEDIGSTRAKTSLVASILTSVTYIASPLSCVIVMRLGSRKSAFAAGVLLSMSCITSSFVTRIEVLYVTFGLFYGFGNSLMMNMLFIVVFQYFERKSALVCGIVSAAVPLSPIALTKPLSYLLEKYGWRVILRILSAPLAFVSLFGFVFLVPKAIMPAQRAEKNVRQRFRSLSKQPAFVIWLVGIFIARLGGDIMTIHQTQFCIEFGIPWEKAAMLPLYMGIGNTIGRLGLGQLLHTRLLHPISTYQVIMVLGGTTALVSALSSTYTHIVIFSILYMAFDGSVQGLDAVPVSIISGQALFEEAFGITLLVQGISRLIGPPSLGLIVDETGNYMLLFYAIAVPSIIGAIVLLGLRCVKSNVFSNTEKELRDLSKNPENNNEEMESASEKQTMLVQYESSI